MIEIEFNGEPTKIADGATISDLLAHTKIDPRFCAVESNLEIVPKSQYVSHIVREGDKIEVVTLVGGG